MLWMTEGASLSRPIKIILHGYLKKLYPQDITLSGETVAELINGLCKVAKRELAPDPLKGKHHLAVAGYNTKESLYEPLAFGVTEIHITPDFVAGKSGAFIKIAIGIALVAVAPYAAGAIGGVGAGVATSAAGLAASNFVAGALFKIGLSLILGGVMELLSPAPQLDTGGSGGSDPAPSRYFGSDQNTTAIGTRIPMLYGTHIGWGHIISFNVSSSALAVAT